MWWRGNEMTAVTACVTVKGNWREDFEEVAGGLTLTGKTLASM
jgi:hypothetical protein